MMMASRLECIPIYERAARLATQPAFHYDQASVTSITEHRTVQIVLSNPSSGESVQTQADTRWASRTRQSCLALILIAKLSAAAQSTAPEILAIFPSSGPEGTRITISGKNMIAVSSVLFGDTQAVFRSVSPEDLIAIIPHKVPTLQHHRDHPARTDQQPTSVRRRERPTHPR